MGAFVAGFQSIATERLKSANEYSIIAANKRSHYSNLFPKKQKENQI